MQIGYALSSEEFGPADLLRQAEQAEECGFSFALISDHYHPWIDEQGQSPFVWSVLGGIAASTNRLIVGTSVTCPSFRMHPAVIAQAAATAAAMLPGRFILGLGSGENLNEHILGQRWPEPKVRQEMLEEAIEIIRCLWAGDYASHYGRYFSMENARIYTLPSQLPPLYLAAAGPASAKMASRIGDGLIATSPDASLVQAFEAAGGRGKPKIAQITVCWAPNEGSAIETALNYWPNAVVPAAVKNDIALPSQFKELARLASREDIAKQVICGPDPEKHFKAIDEYRQAGFDRIYIHQVGPDQGGFFEFYRREIVPHFDADVNASTR